MTETNQKIFTAAEIHTALVLYAVEYMKQWRSDIIDEKELKRNEMLKELGFTSSKSFQESNKAISPSVRRKTFDWYLEKFPGYIFLKVYDFVTLLQKYNLVCGRFDEYEGDIPYEKLEEIADVKRLLEMYKDDNPYSNKYTNENTIGYMPGRMYRDEGWVSDRVPIEEIRRDSYDKTSRYPFYNPNLKELDNRELFIAAPAQDMKGRKLNYHIESKDPFVFQLFPYGVVIFSKWGDEANDPMLEERKL